MNKKAVAVLLLLVLVGVFLVISCSSSPSSDKAEQSKAVSGVSANIPPPQQGSTTHSAAPLQSVTVAPAPAA